MFSSQIIYPPLQDQKEGVGMTWCVARLVLAWVCLPLAVACFIGYLVLNTTAPVPAGELRLMLCDILRERGHYLAAGFLLAALAPWLFEALGRSGDKTREADAPADRSRE
jgi:hypothetical protein